MTFSSNRKATMLIRPNSSGINKGNTAVASPRIIDASCTFAPSLCDASKRIMESRREPGAEKSHERLHNAGA